LHGVQNNEESLQVVLKTRCTEDKIKVYQENTDMHMWLIDLQGNKYACV